MVFLVGPFPSHSDPLHPSTPIKSVLTPTSTNDFYSGDLVEAWDHRWEWDEDCVSSGELDKWARLADPPVDDFLASLPPAQISTQPDLLLLVLSRLSLESEAAGPAHRLWHELTRLPPVGSTNDEVIRGQSFFWEHSGPILSSLLHFSLAGGFSAPRISSDLHKGSYLIPPVSKDKTEYLPITEKSSKRTLGRLYETGQFVLDVMGCPTVLPVTAPSEVKLAHSVQQHSGLASLSPPTVVDPMMLQKGIILSLEGAGEAWKAAVRVRLLHGVVRQRISRSRRRMQEARDEPEEQEDEVLPLNQEDMVGTLASFAVAPLWCLERMKVLRPMNYQGHVPNERDRLAYLRTWRHIGFYLGIPPSLLARHFSELGPSNKFLASIVCHLFPSPTGPKPVLPPPTQAVLTAIASGGPTRLAYHQSLTRFLVGDPLADYLGLPAVTLWGGVKLHLSLLALTYGDRFAAVYPSARWRASRVALVREGLGRMIKMGLGVRKSVYRPREEGTGELGEKEREEERALTDPEGGMRMMRAYKLMLAELVVVSIGALVITGAAVWVVASKAVGLLLN